MSRSLVEYRGYDIWKEHPPIPGTYFVYQHKEFTGDTDNRSGFAQDLDASKADIDFLEGDDA